MTDNKQKTVSKTNDGSNTFVAAVTGAVVGAGVVAAGVVVMRNDKNKAKAKKIIDDVKSKAASFMQAADDQIDETKSKIKKTEKAAKDSKQEVKKIWKN